MVIEQKNQEGIIMGINAHPVNHFGEFVVQCGFPLDLNFG